MKYANLTNVDCRVFEQEEQIELLFRDDGVGFDSLVVSKGLGLRHMEERAKTIEGLFQIVSVIGHGTEISVSVPRERGHDETD